MNEYSNVKTEILERKKGKEEAGTYDSFKGRREKREWLREICRAGKKKGIFDIFLSFIVRILKCILDRLEPPLPLPY